MMDFDFGDPLRKRINRDEQGDGRDESKRTKLLGANNENEITPPPPLTVEGAQPMQLEPQVRPDPANGGRAANGNTVHLYFMKMGQGDCTLVVSPDNKIFIIDMGTSGDGGPQINENIKTFLRQPNLLGLDNTAESIIVTHTDRDHVNKLYLLAQLNPAVFASRIYHTNTFDKSRPSVLRTLRLAVQIYRISGISYTTASQVPLAQPTYANFPANFRQNPPANALSPVAQYHSVSSNFPLVIDGNVVLNVKNIRNTAVGPATEDPVDPPLFEPYYEDEKGVVIYENGGFSIRILVANYRNCLNAFSIAQPNNNNIATWTTTYNDLRQNNIASSRIGVQDVNRASAVVHIRYQIAPGNVENYVICGDATQEALDMIRASYPDLENITVIQAPHHGSGSHGSDSIDFFNQMAPQIAVYSSPYYKENAGHGHPRMISIERMQAAMAQNNAFLSSYGGWRGTKIDREENPEIGAAKTYHQFINMPYRIYVTGWMAQGYYHYQAPLNTPANHPNFRDPVERLAVQDGLPIPPPPPPVEGGAPIIEGQP